MLQQNAARRMLHDPGIFCPSNRTGGALWLLAECPPPHVVQSDQSPRWLLTDANVVHPHAGESTDMVDLVGWVTVGVQHIPRSEDVPVVRPFLLEHMQVKFRCPLAAPRAGGYRRTGAGAGGLKVSAIVCALRACRCAR